MKLQSKIKVTWNDTRSTSKTQFMIGEIMKVEKPIGSEITEVIFKYSDTDGVFYSSRRYIITKDEANALYSLVAPNLPDVSVVGYSVFEETIYIEVFKIKMAERFSELSVADIKII